MHRTLPRCYDKGNQPDFQRGFSLIEILMVLVLMTLVGLASYYSFFAHLRLSKPEDQALKIADMFQEGRQNALAKRQVMRVEIDLQDNEVRLIDENTPGTDDDDEQIRELSLLPSDEASLEDGLPPADDKPNKSLKMPNARFEKGTHKTNSHSSKVFTIRFKSNGTAIDRDNNPTGTNVYVAGKRQSGQAIAEIVRAISVDPSGVVRFWTYDAKASAADRWKHK